MYLKFMEQPQEKTIPEKFHDNLSFFLANQIVNNGADTKEVTTLLSDLPVDLQHFNPLEHWKFYHIFSYETESDSPFALTTKNNCLFGRSAVRLYESLDCGTADHNFTAFEGFEVWLLDDMTFVTVGIHQVEVEAEFGTYTANYRYPKPLSQCDFDVETFLQDDFFYLLAETVLDE